MPNEEHLAILRQGVEAWNAWREQNSDIGPDLRKADLRRAFLRGADLRRTDLCQVALGEANLSGANLSEAHLRAANLSGANLRGANLSGANLSGANLREADLREANLGEANQLADTSFEPPDPRLVRYDDGPRMIGTDLRGANLSGADLSAANLSGADFRLADLYDADLRGALLRRADLRTTNLRNADLSGADLQGAVLVDTWLANAKLTGCRVYGISAWDLNLDEAEQVDLIITRDNEPEVTVDNLEVAQFIYLLINNERIRHVIDTVTSKVVLILGRFTPERKAVLDALRQQLRQRDYLPVLFDFEKPASKDLTGTVQTLANMARFVIADLTDPSSVPHELATIAPNTVVPVQPVLLEGQPEYAMFVDLKRRHHWVLKPYRYAAPEQLLADLGEHVIAPAEAKAEALRHELTEG